MHKIKVTDVRSIAGDSAFLIDNGKTAVLCDTGFAFTGYAVAKNIKEALGDRKLDYIFLTHSHYDHALGTPYVQKYYPEAKVVAGEYAAKIFAKDSAKALMRDLDSKFAKKCGVDSYEDLIDGLCVDITVSDGDTVRAGDMTFIAISLPGHTRCSTAFYLADRKLLVGSETLGIYDGDSLIFPSYLVGYQMTLDSIDKALALDIERIILPHFGLLSREQTEYYLENIRNNAVDTAVEIADMLRSGSSKQSTVEYFKNKIYHGAIRDTYPPDALELNTTIMVNLIEKELVLPQG